MTEWSPERDGTVARYNATTAGYDDVPVASAAVLTLADTNGGTAAVDASNYGAADITLTGNVALSVTNVPTDGKMWTVTFIVRQGDGPYTVTWPTTTRWASGSAPTLSATAAAIDVYRLTTFNGGTTWYGQTIGKAFA